ncbi:MAG: class I SAM-dependent methyltransferase [Bacteroidales bacterium]|nr:class I SAM-dependent methyltransferase [Bacteroidales bacterium]
MKQPCFPIRLLTVLLLLSGFTALIGQAQTEKEYKPRTGQDGKDVIWVPTPQVNVMKMLDIARVTPEDFVIDLGSGDGRLVIEAARRGTRARGIEYNPEMVELSRRRAVQSRVSDLTEFIEGDLFTFTHNFQRYSGSVSDGVIEGTVTTGNKCRMWRAERIDGLF